VIRLYDFDPLRVRREKLSRIHTSGGSAPDPSSSPPAKRTSLFRKQQPEAKSVDGVRNGIHLVTDETVLAKDQPLTEETRTGRDLPYTYVQFMSTAEVTLIDGDRIVAVEVGHDGGARCRADETAARRTTELCASKSGADDYDVLSGVRRGTGVDHESWCAGPRCAVAKQVSDAWSCIYTGRLVGKGSTQQLAHADVF
jgi:hypothetical protein